MIAQSLSPTLSQDQIDVIQRAVTEVATGVGFGVVAIIIERGEPKRVQQTVDYFLRPRPPGSPPCPMTG